MILLYLFLIPFAILLETVLIWVGAKIADVEDAMWAKSFTAAIPCVIIGTLSAFIGGVVGVLVSAVICVYILKYVFDTDRDRAINIFILPVLTSLIVALFSS